jgi:glycosyltransferase involved in cell wall biosynthesis
MSSVHFKVIIQAYNCKRWILECLKSVSRQDYDNWQAVIHVEPSLDKTHKLVHTYLREIKDDRFIWVKNQRRRLRPTNDIEAIKLSKPHNEDVIMILDGDDWLYSDHVFSYLNKVYQNEDIWVTWGSYIHSHNGERGKAAQPIPEPDDDAFNGRRCWRYSHLKTFRYFLWKGVRDEDLREMQTSGYYPVAWDMAMMFPMVEMAGKEHGKYISKILYLYNTENPISNEKVRYEKCLQCSNEICNQRTPYERRTKEELCNLP